jgi:hypothetical protein
LKVLHDGTRAVQPTELLVVPESEMDRASRCVFRRR